MNANILCIWKNCGFSWCLLKNKEAGNGSSFSCNKQLVLIEPLCLEECACRCSGDKENDKPSVIMRRAAIVCSHTFSNRQLDSLSWDGKCQPDLVNVNNSQQGSWRAPPLEQGPCCWASQNTTNDREIWRGLFDCMLLKVTKWSIWILECLQHASKVTIKIDFESCLIISK